MKTVILAATLASHSVITPELIEAIAIIEGNDADKHGTHGERGWWQMRPCAVADARKWLLNRGTELSDDEIYGSREAMSQAAEAYLHVLETRATFIKQPHAAILVMLWNAGNGRSRMHALESGYVTRVLNTRDALLDKKLKAMEKDAVESGRRLTKRTR